jgi:predicted nucleic acid-binding protein
LILVDTSVWIDFFRPSPGPAGIELAGMIERAESFALAGVIVTEILQGVGHQARRMEQYLALWDLLEPRGLATYREAASIFRAGRSKGIALQTVDTLIAAIALEHRASLFSLDKDFARIASVTPLKLHGRVQDSI